MSPSVLPVHPEVGQWPLLALLSPSNAQQSLGRGWAVEGSHFACGNILPPQLLCNYFFISVLLHDAMQIPAGSSTCHGGPISGHCGRTCTAVLRWY